jgi:hypothetical protein
MDIMNETRLPDFDDMLQISRDIESLMLQKLTLEVEISEKESEAIHYHLENTLVNGKPPSMEYAKLVFKPVGINEELIPIRKELADVEASLAGRKAVFEVYKSMIAVWQTESANKRAVTI